jgi:cellulose synthase/poly-beta-1,6-N-acetylglucosamine synthase-like glycosyltransferase
MRAWTDVPDTFQKVMKQQTRWKKSFIRNIFFTGRFYWRKPFFAALLYYLHIVLVLFGPLIVLRHMFYLTVNGNLFNIFLYVLGIVFVGFVFGLSFRYENPHDSKWKYRPLMSLFSAFILSWLIFYSAFTIRRNIWARG